MGIEMGLWRVDGERPTRLTPSALPLEGWLENYLAAEPGLLGETLLLIGRQVATAQGKYIDLLAIDADGCVHVLELKRDKTPRDVVAQVLDYGSWVSTLTRDDIRAIAQDYLKRPFEEAFDERFGAAPPDEINGELRLTIVASSLDAASERIVTYLRTFGVPVNAVFFSHVVDDDRRYLARTWLAGEEEDAPSSGGRSAGKRAEWNGTDWFVSFGDEPGGRAWADGLRYGFVSAGGAAWFTRTLQAVPVGARVNVHLPGRGYVAVGRTTGPARPVTEVVVEVDAVPRRLLDLPLDGSYAPSEDADPSGVEHVIPVEWIAAVPASEAFWEKGMFANQNSACKLRQEFTLKRLADHFRLDD